MTAPTLEVQDIQRLMQNTATTSATVEKILELLTTGRQKRVSGAKELVEEILASEKVVARRALKERLGVSDSELSRCLGALEAEGKVMRRVDAKDGRRTICVYVGSSESLTTDERRLLAFVHGNPDLPYRELQAASGITSQRAFQAAFYKLLSMGLVAQADADGRMYAVVTPRGLQTVRGGAC